MPGKDTIGSNSSDRTDWSSAWEAVSRLAATHESLQGVDHPHRSPLIEESTGPDSAAAAVKHMTPIDHDQLAGAVAEIEQASAALRRSEPALELGFPSAPARIEGRKYWSVWILIGGIWISAIVLVVGATSAILYLLG
jgi:hypothetical protein